MNNEEYVININKVKATAFDECKRIVDSETSNFISYENGMEIAKLIKAVSTFIETVKECGGASNE